MVVLRWTTSVLFLSLVSYEARDQSEERNLSIRKKKEDVFANGRKEGRKEGRRAH